MCSSDPIASHIRSGPEGAVTVFVIDPVADMRAYIRYCLDSYAERCLDVLELERSTGMVATIVAAAPALVVACHDDRVDGLALCRELHEPAAGRVRLLLIVPEDSGRNFRAAAMMAGATGVVCTPINVRRLHDAVRRALRDWPP